MKNSIKTKLVVIFLIAAIFLQSCGEGWVPKSDPSAPIERPPEPPAIVIAIPITREMMANCGGGHGAKLAALAKDVKGCVEMLKHGLRAKRIAEFLARGLTTAALIDELNRIEPIKCQQESNGALNYACWFIAKGVNVLVIFGETLKNPTVFPLKTSEKMSLAQNLNKWFEVRFNKELEAATAITTVATLKSIINCVGDLIKSPAPAAQLVPAAALAIPATATAVYPLQDLTPLHYDSDPNTTWAYSYTIELRDFSPEEVETLLLLGVVYVAGVVVITLATGGTMTVPVLALVVL